MIIVRSVVAAVAALIAGAVCFGPAASAALAQSYPTRVIKMVVPFTPGSPMT
jgi:tripartite-type tricarboxylate transporter receptor subunit TctC